MKNFQELRQGNQYQSGTNENTRIEVMKPIIEANEKMMEIRFKGLFFELKANWSLSRKSVSWSTDLTKAEYIKLTSSVFGLRKNIEKHPPRLSINGDGRVTIYGGGNYYVNVLSNEEIEIL